MSYINEETLDYPVTESQIKALEAFDNVSFPDPFVAPAPFAKVLGTVRPDYDPRTERVEEGDPVKIDGQWQQAWRVVALSAEEVAALALAAQQELEREIVRRVDERLDAFAQTRKYDDIKSLASWAGDEDPVYNVEGTYGKRKRSETYRKLEDIKLRALAGNWPTEGAGQVPTSYEDIEAELPVLEWPNPEGQAA